MIEKSRIKTPSRFQMARPPKPLATAVSRHACGVGLAVRDPHFHLPQHRHDLFRRPPILESIGIPRSFVRKYFTAWPVAGGWYKSMRETIYQPMTWAVPVGAPEVVTPGRAPENTGKVRNLSNVRNGYGSASRLTV
jgi:hypothetical protein